jgi:hypothetical protein
VGGGTWGTALYTVEVWVLGVGMSTPGAQTALYVEDRGLQVPMALEHGPVTSSGQAAPGSDPRIRHRIQIGMFRTIRLDHTNCLQVAIKTQSFLVYVCRFLIDCCRIHNKKSSKILLLQKKLIILPFFSFTVTACDLLESFDLYIKVTYSLRPHT